MSCYELIVWVGGCCGGIGRVGVCQCVLWCRVEVCWGVLRVSQCMCTHSGLKVAVPMRPFWMGDEWMNEWLSVLPPPTHTHTHTHHSHTHTYTQEYSQVSFDTLMILQNDTLHAEIGT